MKILNCWTKKVETHNVRSYLWPNLGVLGEGGTSQNGLLNKTFETAKHKKIKLTIEEVVCETNVLTKFGDQILLTKFRFRCIDLFFAIPFCKEIAKKRKDWNWNCKEKINTSKPPQCDSAIGLHLLRLQNKSAPTATMIRNFRSFPG